MRIICPYRIKTAASQTINLQSHQLLQCLVIMSDCDEHHRHNRVCGSFTTNMFPVIWRGQTVTIPHYLTSLSTAEILLETDE